MCTSLKPWFDCEVIVASENRHTLVENIDGITVRRLGVALHLAGAPVCPAMPRAIARSQADLVHMQWPNPAAFLAFLASGYRGPLIVSWQSDVVRQRFLDRLFAPVTRVVLSRAALVLASSPDYAANSPVLNQWTDRVRVVPIGISDESLRNIDSAAVGEIRSKYGPRIVLGVGRLVYYKGFEHLIRAARSIDGVVLIIGEGPLRARLEQEIERQGVAARVFLLGHVRDIAAFYHACDVFVLPSIARSEAYGIVQLEAMACQKPIVNTEVGSGVTYVSPNGVTGITVPPADSIALAGAINKLLGNSALRRDLGAAGLRRMREEFSVERMASRLRDLYEEVLRTRPNGVSGELKVFSATRS